MEMMMMDVMMMVVVVVVAVARAAFPLIWLSLHSALSPLSVQDRLETTVPTGWALNTNN